MADHPDHPHGAGARSILVLLTTHWISMAGVTLVTLAGFSWIFLLPVSLRGRVENPYIGILVFIAIFLHKLPEGVTIASLMVAGGRSHQRAVGAAGLLGLATLVGVIVTDGLGFLVTHGLAIAAGVTIYVAASNLVPEFQGKKGWKLPAAFFAGAVVFYATKLLLND